ncbi:TetR/AcrR family transcriptional regulator [Nocardia sp. NBC_00565]|uniref:TetR/AcrR family transcriptional regulator n=1 Tax=Nocardia sp. NBC_00565 TaxID=2975993 RepID=UPI002E80078D|nr:TetR/AcrR family transcriptional regulator [Nocardia sp. NBC_00565]WUC04031.1 TetR/AcrR family transcriptional regulator [Nocardia sp. NBC_00565]
MTEQAVRRRTGGRSARVRQAVLDAALQALAEHGPDGVSVAEVARQAGVHETSIYRRWGTREQLVMDALLAYSQRELPVPDTGTLREDLRTFLRSVSTYLDSPLGKALARAMATSDDDETLAASRAQFWESRLELARVMIDRAVDRGDLPRDTDPTLTLELLIAPLHFRALLTRQPLDDDHAERMVDTLLRGLTH